MRFHCSKVMTNVQIIICGRSWKSGGKWSKLLSILKWIPVLIILSIVGWSYYAYVIKVCLISMEPSWTQIFFLTIYHVLLWIFLWSYKQTIVTDTTQIPEQFKIPTEAQERMRKVISIANEMQTFENIIRTRKLHVQTKAYWGQGQGYVRYCETCNIIKPDRAHHCQCCGSCVLKMDHHCPFVNNCVGFKNYKYFVLFVGYALIYCFFIAVTTFPYAIDYFYFDRWDAPIVGRIHVIAVFIVASLFSISLGALNGVHLYLICRNMTTIDMLQVPLFSYGPDRRGFNLGVRNNFIQVFGTDKSKWFLPVFSSVGDGVTFQTRMEWEQERMMWGDSAAGLNSSYSLARLV